DVDSAMRLREVRLSDTGDLLSALRNVEPARMPAASTETMTDVCFMTPPVSCSSDFTGDVKHKLFLCGLRSNWQPRIVWYDQAVAKGLQPFNSRTAWSATPVTGRFFAPIDGCNDALENFQFSQRSNWTCLAGEAGLYSSRSSRACSR